MKRWRSKAKCAVAAAQDVERRGADHQEAAGASDPGEFARREMFFARGQVGDDVQRHDEVEGGVREGQPTDVALHGVADAQLAGVAQAVAAVIQRHDGPAALALQKMGEVAGAAAGLEGAGDFASFEVRLQHAEEDGAHAAVPPEVFLGLADVGEFRRVHEAVHAGPLRGKQKRWATDERR